MRISVQTGGIEEHIGTDACYKLIKEAGFDAVDVNIDHLLTPQEIKSGKRAAAFEGSDEEILAYFTPWKAAAEKYGLDNYQAHAPFPSYVVDPTGEYNVYLLRILEKTIMGCAYIGCRRLIIHPFFLGYGDQVDEKTEWETNIRCYAALIPAAKHYGVTICLENMFMRYNGKIYAACCSDIDTACRYVDTLNEMAGEEVFGFCLDTGHLLLTGLDVLKAMTKLGGRIKAFHVHDNNGWDDQHLAPYMGRLDWKRFEEGLREIGYSDTLSFETFNVMNAVDSELWPQALAFIAQTGRLFARRASAV